MTDVETLARDAATGLRRSVEQFDSVELATRPTRPRRRSPVFVGLAAIALVIVVVAAIVAFAGADDTHEPASRTHAIWDRVSMRRAFGVSTFMSSVVGTRWGFLAAGAVDHSCPRSAPPWACQTSRLWYSHRGKNWTAVSLPALQGAESDVTLGQVGDRALAIWGSPRGLEAWWSSDGREWHRSTVRQASYQSDRTTPSSSWDLGAWSGGVVASEIGGTGQRSWTSRDGSTWTLTTADTDYARPAFLFPQGVALHDGWTGLNGGVGSLSNGASSGVPQVWRSASGRNWAPIASDPPERLMPHLVPAAEHRYVLAAQFRIPGVAPQHVGLYRTSDGHHWTEVRSFAENFPDANPFAIARAGGWWIVSGTTGPSGAQSTALWTTQDLVAWQQLPPRPGRFGAPAMLANRGSTVLAVPRRGRWLRIAHLSDEDT